MEILGSHFRVDVNAHVLAIGLFNPGSERTQIGINWEQIGLNGNYIVRDLWRQKDLGVFSGNFSTEVPPHGVVLVKINSKK